MSALTVEGMAALGAAELYRAEPTPDTLYSLAEDWRNARHGERLEAARVTGAILAADELGLREADIVAATGLTRDMVRRALGK